MCGISRGNNRAKIHVLRNRDLCGGLWVGIGNRWPRNDDGQDTVLHVRDNLLNLSFPLETTRGGGGRKEADCGITRNGHGSIKLAKPPLFDGEAGVRKHGFRLAGNRELFHASVRASGQGNSQITLLQPGQLQHRLHEICIFIIEDIRPDGIIALNHSRLQRKRGGR